MSRGWTGFVLDRWDALRASYWFFPALMTTASAGAAIGLLEIDSWEAAKLPWLGETSADTARALLSTTTGAMMTVAGVVFSITIVALTLTSAQFGPRLLRTFLRDRGSQFTLGAFLSGFVFNLLVLQAVEEAERMPELATAASLSIAVGSLFVLIYFVHHMANSIQASNVIAAVACEIDQQLPTLFPERIGRAASKISEADRLRLDQIDSQGDPLRAECDGYLRVLDLEALFELAVERDLLVRVDSRPGDFCTPGSVLARVQPGSHLRDSDREHLVQCFILGDHRTAVQDIEFLTDQLSEMAVRALSSGINDPRTAIDCIHRLGSLLAQLASREMPSGARVDDEGRLRVLANATSFESLVASCFDSIRRYGAQDVDVTVAVLEAIAAGEANARDADRERVLQEHAHEIVKAFEEKRCESKRDRGRVESALASTLARLEAFSQDSARAVV